MAWNPPGSLLHFPPPGLSTMIVIGGTVHSGSGFGGGGVGRVIFLIFAMSGPRDHGLGGLDLDRHRGRGDRLDGQDRGDRGVDQPPPAGFMCTIGLSRTSPSSTHQTKNACTPR